MPATEHTAEVFLAQVMKQIICEFRQMSFKTFFFSPHREMMVLRRTRRRETGEGPANRHVLMATLSKIDGGVGGWWWSQGAEELTDMKNRHVTQHTHTPIQPQTIPASPHSIITTQHQQKIHWDYYFIPPECFMTDKTEIQPRFNRIKSDCAWMQKFCLNRSDEL